MAVSDKLIAYTISGPGIDPNKYGSPTMTAEKVISQIFAVLTFIAFVYYGIQVILAGYAFFTSEGDKGKIESARKRLTEGVLGIFIVVIALGLAALLASLLGLNNIFDLEATFQLMGL